ncbi:hypothetical protein BJV78DRAFT_100311 [Lactifluus subvellereus]|nr:hypothetical protein BJV78DRAFT_100311 [Lactifluus subvellereus]
MDVAVKIERPFLPPPGQTQSSTIQPLSFNCMQLDDPPSPGKLTGPSYSDSGPHTRHTAAGVSIDPDMVPCRHLLSSPLMDQGNSCLPCRAKGLPQVPNSHSLARPAAIVDKENVSPLFLDTNSHQRPISTPPQPVPVSVARPHQLGPFIPAGLPPVQTLLSMTLCGHPITFDLKTLDDDPRSIIELLTSTSSDRDKWMIVGAFYRRKGNIHAALMVVTTMVKVLNNLGLNECDMRPAFLMLSSCHTELWKQTRAKDGSETVTSAAHLDMSRRWLQLVYGPLNPEPTSGDDSEVLDTLAQVDATPRHTHDVPSAHENVTCDKTRISSTDVERDLQVLRDRQALHVEELASTRESKRRLEDEAVNERVTRRRLERSLRDLKAKLAKAQRRADDAHALVRMEANTRRRCEEVVAEERAKRRALEERFRRQAQSARPLLEGLHGLFQRVGGPVKSDAFVGPAIGGSPTTVAHGSHT